MAECNPTEKSPNEGVDLTSITQILNILLAAFNIMKTPAKKIPPFLLLAGSRIKPGMSWRNTTARAIAEFEKETGVSLGNVYSDGPNIAAAKIKHQIKEMHAEISQNMVVETAIAPGSIGITGSSPVGPIVGSNTGIIKSMGGGH